jgi:hypothetical protein
MKPGTSMCVGQAPICFNDGGLRLERRLDIAEAFAQQEIVG